MTDLIIISLITLGKSLLLFTFVLLVFYVLEKFISMPRLGKYTKIIPIFIVHYVFVCIISSVLMSIIFFGYLSDINMILLFIPISLFIIKYFNLSVKLEFVVIFCISIVISIFLDFYVDSIRYDFFGGLIYIYLCLIFLYYFMSVVIYFIISFYVVLKRAIFYGGLFIIYKFQEAMLSAIMLLIGVFAGGAIAVLALAAVAIHLPYIILGIIGLIYLAPLYFYLKEELDILKEKKSAKLNKYNFEREV